MLVKGLPERCWVTCYYIYLIYFHCICLIKFATNNLTTRYLVSRSLWKSLGFYPSEYVGTKFLFWKVYLCQLIFLTPWSHWLCWWVLLLSIRVSLIPYMTSLSLYFYMLLSHAWSAWSFYSHRYSICQKEKPYHDSAFLSQWLSQIGWSSISGWKMSQCHLPLSTQISPNRPISKKLGLETI